MISYITPVGWGGFAPPNPPNIMTIILTSEFHAITITVFVMFYYYNMKWEGFSDDMFDIALE